MRACRVILFSVWDEKLNHLCPSAFGSTERVFLAMLPFGALVRVETAIASGYLRCDFFICNQQGVGVRLRCLQPTKAHLLHSEMTKGRLCHVPAKILILPFWFHPTIEAVAGKLQVAGKLLLFKIYLLVTYCHTVTITTTGKIEGHYVVRHPSAW